jgi:hypothetical protein
MSDKAIFLPKAVLVIMWVPILQTRLRPVRLSQGVTRPPFRAYKVRALSGDPP